LKMPRAHLPMSSAAMPASFLPPMGSVIARLPSRIPLGAHAEVDEVVPVERSQQDSHGQAEPTEYLVGFALGVEVRHLILTHEGGHAIVAERHPLTRVFQAGPDDVLVAGVLGGVGHGGCLGQLLLGREVRPVECNAERPIGALKRLLEALGIVERAMPPS
jgi:hypothetical protein